MTLGQQLLATLSERPMTPSELFDKLVTMGFHYQNVLSAIFEYLANGKIRFTVAGSHLEVTE